MTFKDLTPKKKLEHIWEYYKWVILGVLFVVIAGGSLAYTMMLKPRLETYAGLAVYGSHINPENCRNIADSLNEKIQMPKENNTITVTNYYFNPEDKMFNVEMEQKFITYLYNLELNVITGDEGYTNLFVDSEYVAPLEEYLTKEQLESLDNEGLIYYREDPLDGKEKAFGINVKNCEVFNKYKVFEDSESPCYATIVPVVDKENNTLDLLKAMGLI